MEVSGGSMEDSLEGDHQSQGPDWEAITIVVRGDEGWTLAVEDRMEPGTNQA